ncbi:MAG: TonB-dependent receptor, partial [Pseudomonadota bacterium]|nr:TonB-dependent receptor [Pseudomonadota bacterium]
QLAMSQVLEEVVVTARQRAETSQEIPMMVQSLTGEDIQKQGITTLEDFSRFVAGLNISTTTPGQNTIVFRGVSDGGGFLVDPTAAIYLDEQPMSLTSAAPDIYPVDIARIEALAGPQSTLYGASSQSGAVRVITNKPDPSEFTANIGAGLGSTSKGGSSYEIDATVNIPVSDTVAIRLSGFSATDAGYIDNVLGTTVEDTVFGSGLGGQKTNSNMLEEDFNEVDWQGARASVRWLADDNWTVTATANFQELEAGGYNDYDPAVGDLQTVKFAEEMRTDDWLQTSLVIEGDLGFAQLVSATSYYDREMLYTNDTQSYAAYFHYSFGVYYGYATYDFGLDPVGYLVNDQSNESLTQEIRLSGSTDRVNWTLGGFWQESEEFWDFHTYVDGYRNSPAFAAWSYYYPGIAPTDAWWNSFQGTDRTDMAVFGEMDIVLIEDRLTALVGGRWYDVDRDLSYTVERPDSRVAQELPDRKASDDGFIPKYGLELQINDDVMVYGVYSEGYRVGGTNRGRGIDLGGPTLPVAYESDILENTEFGLKSTFADGRVVFNAVYYDMKWNDMQIEVTDPSFNLASYSEVDVNGDPIYGSIPFQIVVGNVGDATVTGIDIDLKALIGENLEFGFNLTDIRDAYVEAPAFYNEPRAAGGQIPSGLDPQSALPLFADESYSFYLEYSGINLMGGDGAFRLQHNNVGSSLNQLNDGFTSARLKQGDYKITDAILTLDMDDWQARVYINNLSDERGITYEDSADFDPLWGRNSSNVIRPRNWGLSIRKRF